MCTIWNWNKHEWCVKLDELVLIELEKRAPIQLSNSVILSETLKLGIDSLQQYFLAK